MQNDERLMSPCKERIYWIDALKGICMMAILLFHTDVYYNGGTAITNYNMYVCDALVIFFFLSGYHFYKPGIGNDASRKRFFVRKFKSIMRGIVLPYFVFTALMAFPKAVVHGTGSGFTELAFGILSGRASWFVAALALSELFFSIMLYIGRWKNLLLCPVAILMLVLSIFLSATGINYWWQAENACMAFFYLYSGFFFHQKEMYFNRFGNIYHTSLLSLILILIKMYVMKAGISLVMEPVMISDIPVFIADTFVAVILMVNVAKLLPKVRFVAWTGAHSLVYYFFCGGVPLIISVALNKVGFAYNGAYYRMVLAFLIAYAVTSALVWVVYRYLPFAVGKWGG